MNPSLNRDFNNNICFVLVLVALYLTFYNRIFHFIAFWVDFSAGMRYDKRWKKIHL